MYVIQCFSQRDILAPGARGYSAWLHVPKLGKLYRNSKNPRRALRRSKTAWEEHCKKHNYIPERQLIIVLKCILAFNELG